MESQNGAPKLFLIQFDLRFNRKEFTIEKDGIAMISKTLSSKTETFVDFEDVGAKIVKESSAKLIWLILSLLSFLVMILVLIHRFRGGHVANTAEIFYLTASLVLIGVYYLTRKSLVYLVKSDDTSALVFLADKPDKKTLEDFIAKLLERRDQYLLNRYCTFDLLMPYEQQMNNLTWLYNNEIIEKEKYIEKVKELNELFEDGLRGEGGKAKIGFRPPVE